MLSARLRAAWVDEGIPFAFVWEVEELTHELYAAVLLRVHKGCTGVAELDAQAAARAALWQTQPTPASAMAVPSVSPPRPRAGVSKRAVAVRELALRLRPELLLWWLFSLQNGSLTLVAQIGSSTGKPSATVLSCR